MKNIGGFLELELKEKNHYYSDAIKLNTARNSIEYILRAKKYKKIYLPNYTCDSIIEPAKKLKIEYEFYSIDKNLEPVFDQKIKPGECILYINYFGLKDSFIKKMVPQIDNLIIDNSQAFYTLPFKDTDTVYSPRKFFGVPDGGYLFTDMFIDYSLETDTSYSRLLPLLKRIDLGSEKAYKDYKAKEKKLKYNKIKYMSKLTNELLKSIDYNKIRKKREENFAYLHSEFKEINELSYLIDKNNLKGPMIYPLLVRNKQIRKQLIENKIFVATYWNDSLKRLKINDFERKLVDNLVALPIDQRYDFEELNKIIKKVNKFLY